MVVKNNNIKKDKYINKYIKEIVNYLFLVGKLKWLKRSGWLERKMPDPESVAEHAYRVAMICFVIAPLLNLNRDKLVSMALFHDFAEGVFGDPISEGLTKDTAIRYIDYNKIEKFNDIEFKKNDQKKFIKNLAKKLNLPEIYDLWIEHSFENSKEATVYSDILFQIGKLANVLQALEYQIRGVPEEIVKGFWVSADVYIKNPLLREILKYLKKIKIKKLVVV